jgi:hypothetical protein
MAPWAPIFEMIRRRAGLMQLLAFLPRGLRLAGFSFSDFFMVDELSLLF